MKVSATAIDPPASAATPSGCCSLRGDAIAVGACPSRRARCRPGSRPGRRGARGAPRPRSRRRRWRRRRSRSSPLGCARCARAPGRRAVPPRGFRPAPRPSHRSLGTATIRCRPASATAIRAVGQHERVPGRAQARGEHPAFAARAERRPPAPRRRCRRPAGDRRRSAPPGAGGSRRTRGGRCHRGRRRARDRCRCRRSRSGFRRRRRPCRERRACVRPPSGTGVNAGPTARSLRPSRSCAITPLERRSVALAGGHGDHVAVGVDDHQRRPGANAVLLPCLQLRVVEHRMADPVAGDRPCHGGVVGLVRELRGVHADHHQAIPESLLERAQLLDDAKAVDAAERPEIEHHHATAKVAQRERMVRVDPAARRHEAPVREHVRVWWSSPSIIARGAVKPARARGGRIRALDIMHTEVGWCTGQRREGSAAGRRHFFETLPIPS